MIHELRCRGKLRAILLEPDVLEVACDSRLCGAGKGVVVRHRFKLSTGDLISTHRYKSPERGVSNASSDPDPAVRSA